MASFAHFFTHAPHFLPPLWTQRHADRIHDVRVRDRLRERQVDRLALGDAHVELAATSVGTDREQSLQATHAARIDAGGVLEHLDAVSSPGRPVTSCTSDSIISLMFGCLPTATIFGVSVQAAQSSVGKVLSNIAMWPPMVDSRSTR